MSNQEQTNNPYVDKITEAQVEYKTFANDSLAALDFDVTRALNDGYQPAGPQYQASNGYYVQPMVRVPRMPQPIRG